MLDDLVKGQTRRALSKQDRIRVKVADRVTALTRKVVLYDAFRQLMQPLAVPSSPLRRKLSRRRPS